MKKIYLEPQKDTRKSFYKKAYYTDENGVLTLFSYETKVCTIKENNFFLNGKIEKELLFSNTTLRHIKEFLYQKLGLENLTKKDLEKTLK